MPEEMAEMRNFALILACSLIPLRCYARTLTVANDGPADLATIQAAIDEASEGDMIIVQPGTYKGEGNTNLDFSGKAVTVRSREPNDPNCLRGTVIDAEAEGLIAHFVHGETARTIFEGFTLVAGDISTPVRGVPGFFEFSDDARPTIRAVRVEPAAARQPTLATLAEMSALATGPPYGGRVWDANNPFLQPAATTDYYGSGDVDNDGVLTGADPCLARDIAVGLRDPCIRVDVDGDGDVDEQDVKLIGQAVEGSSLPGWWNSLKTREERNAWITKVIVIDKTDRQPWYYWFQCLSFALQFHIHGAFYRGDLTQTTYDGGPTLFNLPVYHVGIFATGFGHSVNGILVGDDPLDFDDWRFIEPQNDNDILPGMWNMPYGSRVGISAPNFILNGASSTGDRVKFYVDQGDWALQEYRPDFVLTRPVPPPTEPDNSEDAWNPRFTPGEPHMTMLFERCRRDLSHTTDIHIMNSPSVNNLDGQPLTMSSQYSRLLDIRRGPGGPLHMLWTGNADHTPGVFHGILDPRTGCLTDTTRVSVGVRIVRAGRVVVTEAGEIHVFWLEYKNNTGHPYDSGIYWSRWTGSEWQPAENIAHHAESFIDSSNWTKRDHLRYYLDVEPFGDDGVILIWAEPVGYTNDSTITSLLYDGQWGTPQAIETTNARGIEVSTDSEATVHMVYWLADRTATGGSGALMHRKSTDGYSWSAPQAVCPGVQASCPRMAPAPGGKIHLVCEKQIGGRVVPMLTTHNAGRWNTPTELAVSPGANAWYPTVESLTDGRAVVAWSARSHDRVTIETWTAPLAGDFDDSQRVDIADFSIFASAWLAKVREENWNPLCDMSMPADGVINALDLAAVLENWLATIE
jgi:hypothetical protein